MSNKSVEDVWKARQCMGCGFCTVRTNAQSLPAARTYFDDHSTQFKPATIDPSQSFVCPGTEMDMPTLHAQVYGSQPHDPLIGHYRLIAAIRSSGTSIQSRASSGGAIPAILRHLFATGQIDAAYCATNEGAPHDSSGRILRSESEISRIHGSIYHPINFGAELDQLLQENVRFAFVGLPCEVAALEMLKKQRPDIRSRHVLSIGLFCGGINELSGINYYTARYGANALTSANIQYRHGPWPGKMFVRDSHGSALTIPRIRGNTRLGILHYVIAFQGYWMLPRCRICPDQIADFADIAVGDPHSPRFRNLHGQGWSALVVRSERGEQILSSMLTTGDVEQMPLDRTELIESQGYTLDNRRHAQVYVRVAQILGFRPPNIRVYGSLSQTESLRHYVYAAVDLIKLRLPRGRIIAKLYLPWQIFEYLFLTFAPNLVFRRIRKLMRNEIET